jgi:hypothetical protein
MIESPFLWFRFDDAAAAARAAAAYWRTMKGNNNRPICFGSDCSSHFYVSATGFFSARFSIFLL